MVGFFSTRGQNVHNAHSNFTNTTANSSVDATSQDSETNNTVLGIMVLTHSHTRTHARTHARTHTH